MVKKNAVDGEAVSISNGSSNGEASLPDSGAARNGAGIDGVGARKPLKLSTVSHTLDAEIAERLRHFAFRERISESAVIEFSLRAFFEGRDDATLGQELRDRGAGLRRKS